MAARNVHWQEWRRNWTLVLACAFGYSFNSVLNYSFGGQYPDWSSQQSSPTNAVTDHA